jgi:hypothetical protein
MVVVSLEFLIANLTLVNHRCVTLTCALRSSLRDDPSFFHTSNRK